MTYTNEELVGKFVRTGMIMRHIDDGGRGCGKRRHGGPEGHGSEPHGKGGCCHGHGRKGHRRGQARVLTMVSMKEGINQKDLAFLLGVRPQTLGEMLQKLEERGLVARKRSESDGRAVEVTLTDEGRSRAAEIAEHRALAAADILAVLSEDEKEQLGSILDKLGAELDERRPPRRGTCGEAEGEAD
ncbi:MAG: MarR family transcriptional regulator [Eggerthellaceae bacterium]|nr:MarR family transcriptional regulator [Eggerthellaceae bacterium]